MPTTPNYSWPTPADTDLVKDGAEAIRDLGNAIDSTVFANSPGLVHIKTVTDTGVSAVNIGSDADPLFTSDFVNYLIIVDIESSTAVNIRLRANTTDASGSNYDYQATTATATSVSTAALTSQTAFNYIGNFTGASTSRSLIQVFNPQLARATVFQARNIHFNTLQTQFRDAQHTLATAYNGISFLTVAGNFTNIKIKVYGYKD